MRVAADKNPPGFGAYVFVGIDADQDNALDLFVGVNNSGSGDIIALYDPGPGLNNSPSSTTLVTTPLMSYVQTASNYSWQPVTNISDPGVTSTDLDGVSTPGTAEDHFISFMVPFADIVTQLVAQGITGFNQNSEIAYVVGTSQQANALNQDLGGPTGGTNSDQTWEEIGGISIPLTPSGPLVIPPIVPEPASLAILALGAAWALRRRS